MLSTSHGQFWVTSDPLRIEEVVSLVADGRYGAIATFAGTVRSPSGGREVEGIFYEAYPEMAEEKLAEIAAECVQTHDAGRLAMAHRTGQLGVGETSVVIAVAAVRRRAALGSVDHAIERIKQILPVWKKEQFTDGTQWVGWGGAPTPKAAPNR